MFDWVISPLVAWEMLALRMMLYGWLLTIIVGVGTVVWKIAN
jgi:hypothetical protein